MADTLFAPPSLEPEFKQALERFSTSIKTLTNDAASLSKAVNPLESFMQIGQQTLDFYTGLDWLKVYTSAAKPGYFFEFLESLAEIQQEASSRLSNQQQILLSTLVKDGQTIAASTSSSGSPEQLLAKCINSSLDAFEDIKTNISNQAQTLGSIQSALLALYQQSLTELSTSPPQEPKRLGSDQPEVVTPTYD